MCFIDFVHQANLLQAFISAKQVMFLVVSVSFCVETWKLEMFWMNSKKNFVGVLSGAMLTIHWNLAYIHEGLQGVLNDWLVENWQKDFNLETMILASVLFH